jgi:hypothetical protein
MILHLKALNGLLVVFGAIAEDVTCTSNEGTYIGAIYTKL